MSSGGKKTKKPPVERDKNLVETIRNSVVIISGVVQ